MSNSIIHKLVTSFRSDLPDALRKKLDVLRSEEAELTRSYQDLAMAAADGSKSQADADKAHAALMAHHATVARAEAALAAAERRENAQRRELEAGTAAAAWTACVDASKARESIAAEFAAALAKAGTLYAKLKAATVAVHHAVPPGWPTHQTDGFGIDGGALEKLTLSEYAMHRLPAGSNPWGLELASLSGRFPEFTARIEQARDTALRSADAEEAAA